MSVVKFAQLRREEPDLASVIAPLPESLQQRCIAAPGLLAQVIVSNTVTISRSIALSALSALSLYRSIALSALSPGTDLLGPAPGLVAAPEHDPMGPPVHLASEWLKPIYRQVKDQMMKGSYLQVDETPIRYLDPGNGKTGLGYLWVAYRPGEDVPFEWNTTREVRCLEKLGPATPRLVSSLSGYGAPPALLE
jgi:transposase